MQPDDDKLSAHQQLCFCIRKPFRGAAPWFSTCLCHSGVLWKFQKKAFFGSFICSRPVLLWSWIIQSGVYCMYSALPKDVILAHFLTSGKQLVPVNFSVPLKSNWFVKSLKSSPKGMCSVTTLHYYSRQSQSQGVQASELQVSSRWHAKKHWMCQWPKIMQRNVNAGAQTEERGWHDTLSAVQ